jgi:hypothetical protein
MASSTREPRGVTLVRHPDTPCAAVHAVTARVHRAADGTLSAQYVLNGDVARLNVAASSSPPYVGRDLWRHTCCELFVSRGEDAYHEFNFAPSGAWAAYAFERYRHGAPLSGDALGGPLVSALAARTKPDKIELDASIRLDRLSPQLAAAKLLIAVSTVIEEPSGRVSYWALRHPPGKPDFHHRDGFALELDEVRN